MSIWLIRAGGSGEYESKFLSENRVYVTWDGYSEDLSQFSSQEELRTSLATYYPNEKLGTIKNWSSQIWPFAHRMEIDDWVVLPSKKKGSIHFGKLKGNYVFHPKGPDPYFHSRQIEWFATDIPRSNFDQDLLYSFGAFMTICRISRNNAEQRIYDMSKNGWKSQVSSITTIPIEELEESTEGISGTDVERYAKDQIVKFIEARFAGHGMARLVEAILEAKGFFTYRSPEGPDKGVDLLAASGPLGFDGPSICVQVKSGDTPVDRPTLDQLVGAMQNFGADRGLLVSWAGFKSSVDKEVPAQFFRVRLWDQDQLIDELLECYPKLNEELKAELPFKRVWSIAHTES
ncbi:restriction endonuclease [Thermodesulfobacteriota bacterium]